MIFTETEVFSADLSADFINNAAFGNFSSKKQEYKVINLFGNKKENKKKKSVKVEKFDDGFFDISSDLISKEAKKMREDETYKLETNN